MEVYELLIDDDDLGVSAISLVEKPAVEYDFLKFSNDSNMSFSIYDNEKREIFGVIMLADTPIIRNKIPQLGINDVHYIKFSKDTIKKIVLKYFKNKLNDSVNLEHSLFTDGIYLFESYIIDRNMGINPPKEFENINDGSWIGKFKVDNDIVWEKIKNGEFKGFSIEGMFKYDINSEDDDIDEDKFYSEIYEHLKKLI